MKNKKGFTLIELMVVIVIIGILAALAIPKFTNASAKAKIAEAPNFIAAYEHAQLAFVAETGRVTKIDSIPMDTVGFGSAKWYTYDGSTTAGTFTATTKMKLGDVASGAVLKTEVDNASKITHTLGTGFKAYLPNF